MNDAHLRQKEHARELALKHGEGHGLIHEGLPVSRFVHNSELNGKELYNETEMHARTIRD